MYSTFSLIFAEEDMADDFFSAEVKRRDLAKSAVESLRKIFRSQQDLSRMAPHVLLELVREFTSVFDTPTMVYEGVSPELSRRVRKILVPVRTKAANASEHALLIMVVIELWHEIVRDQALRAVLTLEYINRTTVNSEAA
jgi:hypothetical protein